MARAACSRSKGLAGTSISDIAAAADAFPSQITYYFRTKEALFVEAACRDMLYLARATEQAALKAHTPREYTRALAETVTATDSVAFFAEALTLTRRRQDLAPLVERTIERLHAEGARAYASQVERHGWRSLRDPDASSRRFWAVAIGVMVEGFAMGRAAEQMRSELLRALGEQADHDFRKRRRAASPRRRTRHQAFIRWRGPVMTALRMRARDFLSEDELVAVRERFTWKGAALIVHAWALIIAAIALVAWWPNPLTYLVAVGIIGSRQLGLAILMHDGAHGCLSPDEKTNLFLSQWFCAYPVFAETRAYRRYHLQHHARTQQEDDPDLDPVGAVPDHAAELSPQILARYFRADRLPAAQGAIAQRARPVGLAAVAARGAVLGKARSAMRGQCRHVRRLRRGRRVVGLSAVVAGAAVDLADGHHPHPQHRRTCRRARLRAIHCATPAPRTPISSSGCSSRRTM